MKIILSKISDITEKVSKKSDLMWRQNMHSSVVGGLNEYVQYNNKSIIFYSLDSPPTSRESSQPNIGSSTAYEGLPLGISMHDIITEMILICCCICFSTWATKR